ncbi:hypothetical protein AN958_11432 [Leucoagaricus sp. SymC.cos]|nr:hypothetical protein AN958_11432 [Leucoagaricus sp. SymC.cos]
MPAGRVANHSETESSSEEEVQAQTDSKAASPATESESSNSSEDESTDNPQARSETPKAHLAKPQSHLLPATDVSGCSDKDLEELIRGPGILLKSMDLPSSESSEEEEVDDVQLDNESEEGEQGGRSKKLRRSHVQSDDSSDEEMVDNDENEDKPFHTPSRRDSMPPSIACTGRTVEEAAGEAREELQPLSALIPASSRPSQMQTSFQEMSNRLGSIEADKEGNEAFEQVLAEENAVLNLAREKSPPPIREAAEAQLTEHSPQPHLEHDPREDVQEHQQESIPDETEGKDPENGAVPENEDAEGAVPIQAREPDPIESSETPVATQTRQRSPIESAEEQVPSTPHPIPSEPRASTPKPGILQRMKNRMGLASPPKKQPSTSNLNSNLITTPSAKPRSTRSTTSQNQQGPTTRSRIVKTGHEGTDNGGEAEVLVPTEPTGKPSPTRGTTSTTKPMSTRSKTATGKALAEKNMMGKEGKEMPDPPLRRSQRASSRAAGTTLKIPTVSLPNGSQLPAKRKRQNGATTSADDTQESSQPVANSQVKETEKLNDEAKGAPKSPTPPPTNEDVEYNASQSHATGEEVPLPPSPPMSLDAWETMRAETPVGTTQSDPMVDELQSDVEPIPFPLKPQYQRKTAILSRKQSLSRLEQAVHDTRDHRRGKKPAEAMDGPLFMPSESQTPFPYSQYQSQAPDSVVSDSSDSEAEVRKTIVKKPPSSQPQATRYRKLSVLATQAPKLFTSKVLSSVVSDSSDSEAEVRKTIVKKPPSSQPQPTRYQKLSVLATQAPKLFTSEVLRQSTGRLQAPTMSVPSKKKDRLSQMYGAMGMQNGGDDDSDDESGHGSDSESEKASHIPKSRKAGARMKRRMSVS